MLKGLKMKIQLQEPFKSLWNYGYLRQSKKDNRRRVDLFNSGLDRTTISYAKYLICIHRGELLPEGYEVDHIDKDRCNDSITNLQVLTAEEHKEKTIMENTTGRTTVELVCPNCGNNFLREKRNVKPNTTPKCSRTCNAEYNRKHNGWVGKKNK